MEIALNPVESTTYTALTKDVKTAPQMFILGWCADYPDPQNWLSVYWKTGGFGERIGLLEPRFRCTGQSGRYLHSIPPSARICTSRRRDLLVAGAPVAFMWNNVNTYLVKPWVKGIVTTPQDSDWPGEIGSGVHHH